MGAGLVLFAHGARDPRWAEPFERIRGRVAELLPGASVALAFLERMEPSLAQACDQLVQDGCREILVVPVFLGQGGHVREDLPVQLAAVQQTHATVRFSCSAAAGEDAAVIEAIARYCQAQLDAALNAVNP